MTEEERQPGYEDEPASDDGLSEEAKRKMTKVFVPQEPDEDLPQTPEE